MVYYELILILSIWRLTSLLTREDGPFDIFARFRKFVGVRYDEYSNPTGTNSLSKGILCFWCASMWWSFVLSFFSKYSVNFLTFVGVWLAYSAAAIIIDEILARIGGVRP